MTIVRIASAALLAAGLGFAGTANAAPAASLSGDQASAPRSDASAVTPVWHRGYYHYGDYGYYPRYYYPRYYGYYGYPYGYGYYPYYGPSLGFGFTIR